MLPDCGVREGRFHLLGCELEPCPYCDGSLVNCDCVFDNLRLRDTRVHGASTAFLPPAVWEFGLTDEHVARWESLLTAQGRFVYIERPVMCVMCGEPWPELFRAPEGEWARYVDPTMRDFVLCRECFEQIKLATDAASAAASA